MISTICAISEYDTMVSTTLLFTPMILITYTYMQMHNYAVIERNSSSVRL